MKTIETKPGVTLGFVKMEWQPVEPNHYVGRSVSAYFQDEASIAPEYKHYPIIGLLSEITEEQAKELMPEVKVFVPDAKDWKEYTGKELLKMATDSVNIKPEEFNQYLLVKL
jgi:hypothetical protein